MSDFAYKLLLQILPLFVAVVLHEIAHGLAAYSLGDDTAKEAGRFKLHTHFDLWGSFFIPLALYVMNAPFLIGYAKPVPINPCKFQNPVTDMALVAIAGPLSNLVLAILCALLLKNFTNTSYMLQQLSINFIVINLTLFFFNLIPIPPLDGSRILAAFMPIKVAEKFYILEPFGFFLIIGTELICRQISNLVGYNFGIFDTLIKIPLLATIKFLLS